MAGRRGGSPVFRTPPGRGRGDLARPGQLEGGRGVSSSATWPRAGRPAPASWGAGGLELGRLAQQAGPGAGRSGDQVSTPGAPGRAGTGPLRARQGGSVITHRPVRAQARLELARPGGGSARAGLAGPGGWGGPHDRGVTPGQRGGPHDTIRLESGSPQSCRALIHSASEARAMIGLFGPGRTSSPGAARAPGFPGSRSVSAPTGILAWLNLCQLVPGWAVRLCQARGPSSVP